MKQCQKEEETDRHRTRHVLCSRDLASVPVDSTRQVLLCLQQLEAATRQVARIVLRLPIAAQNSEVLLSIQPQLRSRALSQNRLLLPHLSRRMTSAKGTAEGLIVKALMRRSPRSRATLRYSSGLGPTLGTRANVESPPLIASDAPA